MRQSPESVHAVRPAGVFGTLAPQAKFEELREVIRALVGKLEEKNAAAILNYLCSGMTVLAIMEYTTDVLEGRFGVAGGSAILTDGTYYWRRDTKNYVENYSTALPSDFLDHMRKARWRIPPLTDLQVLEIDAYLASHFGLNW